MNTDSNPKDSQKEMSEKLAAKPVGNLSENPTGKPTEELKDKSEGDPKPVNKGANGK